MAHLSEAIRARPVVPDATIYVLNGLLPGTAGSFVAHGLRPILGSFEELEDWARVCALFDEIVELDPGAAEARLADQVDAWRADPSTLSPLPTDAPPPNGFFCGEQVWGEGRVDPPAGSWPPRVPDRT